MSDSHDIMCNGRLSQRHEAATGKVSTVIWEHVKANSVMIFELHPDSEEKSADMSKVKFS